MKLRFLFQLHLPLNSPLPGSELTKEPFRWDQRLFALVLRLPGASSLEAEQLGSVPSDESAVTQMCEVTGGKPTILLSMESFTFPSLVYLSCIQGGNWVMLGVKCLNCSTIR